MNTVIITFLMNHPVIAIIVFVVVFIVFLAILLSKKSFTLNFGENKSITLGSSNEKSSKEPKSYVKSCQFCKDRIKTVTKTRVKKVMDLRAETLHRQMKYFNNSLEEMKFMLQSDYRKWLSDRKPQSGDISNDWEYIMVVDKITICLLTRTIPGIEQMMQENHLADKTDAEFELYKAKAISAIRTDIFRFIESNFMSGYSVKRDEQRKFFDDRWVFISAELDKCFNQARSLSIKCSYDVAEIKSKSDKQIFDQD